MVFLSPSLILLSLFATVSGRMLETDDGAVSTTLRSVGLGALAQDWLGSDRPTYAALFVLFVYLIGLPIMYYTSALAVANTSSPGSPAARSASPDRCWPRSAWPPHFSTRPRPSPWSSGPTDGARERGFRRSNPHPRRRQHHPEAGPLLALGAVACS